MLSSADRDAAAALLLPRVLALVRFYQSPSIDRNELFSAAQYGLVLALKDYDPERGSLEKRVMYFAHLELRRARRRAIGLGNKSKNLVRQSIAHAIATPISIDGDFDSALPATDTVEDDVIALEERAAIVRATKRIKDDDLKLLLDHDFHSIPTRTLREQAGTSRQAVLTRLSRVRREMRDALLADAVIER